MFSISTSEELKRVAYKQPSRNPVLEMAKKHGNLFIGSKFDFENLGLTFTQRILSFLGCLVLGAFLFFYSLYKLVFMAFSPLGFVAPYVLSNILFFVMFGFLSGFKTYFRNLFSKEKKKFSATFIATTVLTVYSAFLMKRRAYIAFVLGIIQMFSFTAFAATFVPGGASGLSALINMLLKN